MSYAPQSFKVAATLSAYRIVAITAAQTVGYPTSGQVLPIGVTADTVETTSEAIPVYGPGQIAKVYFNDSCAAGALVGSDTLGQGIPFSLANTTTSLTLASAYVGVHVGAKVEDTGTLSDVFICPGFDRVAG